MSLRLNLISEDEWKAIRSSGIQKTKWVNSHWITKLRKVVAQFKNDYDGLFLYTRVEHFPINARYIQTAETSPVFQLFCLHSNTFIPSFYNRPEYEYLPYWKSSSVDDNIVNTFRSFDLNKYSVGSKHELEFDGYILFALQSKIDQFDKELFVKIIEWCNDNKKLVVLKLHPYTTPDNYIFPILRELKSQQKLGYVKIVTHEYNIDTLIDQSDKVWTFNSGVTLNSILRGKPVSTFWNCDYNPLCTRCYTPEQANLTQYPNDDLLYRYLSWFYHRYTIDIGFDIAKDRFTQLFDHFYRDNKSLESYMSMDWK
jgi:capsule polysaccharide modification protein KpsS